MRRPTTDPLFAFQTMLLALYCAASVDDPRRWYCDCGAHLHHRLIAYDRMNVCIQLMFLEINKCAVPLNS